MNFEKEYQKIANLVSEDLLKVEEYLKSEIDVFPAVNPFLEKFLTGKSKRIRPTIAFLYLRANDLKPDTKHYILQSAIEIIHNASLLHDDVIDECSTRRGNITLNKEFNNKTAVLCGDYLLALALNKLNQLNTPKITSICAETMREMCKGEIFQDFMKGKIPTLKEYLTKTEQKTAGLFRAAIEGSMILSGLKDTTKSADFATNFGIAFQIRDDLLNIIQNDNLKPSNNDIKCGIYNAPVIFAQNTNDLSQGIEKTKDLLNNYVVKSQEIIETLNDNPYKTGLGELLGLLNNA